MLKTFLRLAQATSMERDGPHRAVSDHRVGVLTCTDCDLAQLLRRRLGLNILRRYQIERVDAVERLQFAEVVAQ